MTTEPRDLLATELERAASEFQRRAGATLSLHGRIIEEIGNVLEAYKSQGVRP